MFERIKKAALKKWRKQALISIISAVLCFIPMGLFLNSYKDLGNMQRGDLWEGQNVRVQIPWNLGAFEELSHKGTGIIIGRVYAIPFDDPDEELICVLGARAEGRAMAKLDAQDVSYTETPKAVSLYGYLEKMDPMDITYVKEYMESVGYDPETLNNNLIQYVLYVKGTRPYILYLLVLVGIFMMIRGIRLFICAGGKAYEDVLFKNMKAVGYDEEAAMQELTQANAYAGGRIMVGKHFTFLNVAGTHPEVIENDKIRWVYSKDGFFNETTSFLLVGILLALAGFILIRFSAFGEDSNPPTSLYIYTEGRNKPYVIGLGRSRFYLDSVFSDLQKHCPEDMEIGYSKYREQEFKKNLK